MTRKIEHGDWQTPLALARRTLAIVRSLEPASIVEPTCGEGTFLLASAEAFPRATLCGWEIGSGYVETARDRVPAARVTRADFFDVAWESELARLAEPILAVGNPPWVTNARLGALGSKNLPEKENFKKLGGLDARTGKSNFDISEWMILRLLEALRGRSATIAFLCKSTVARHVIEHAEIRPGGLWRIDAMEHFGASVDAVLFVAHTGRGDGSWPVHSSLDAREPEASLGVAGNAVVADVDCFARTSHLIGDSSPEWRSGLKHDCARIMELEWKGGWVNGMGERVDVEEELVFPLRKSSDVANGRAAPTRAVIVPQRRLSDDTAALGKTAPRAWAYLSKHRAAFEARKSSIYDGQPPFAIFGIGPYSFAPWKVAVSGLYKRFSPALVGSREGKPTMLDDTCYFLPFDAREDAEEALDALRSSAASEFFRARIFWDAKRPIRKSILQTLDLAALRAELKASEASL